MDAAMHIPEDHRFGIADAKAHLSSLVTRVEQAGESSCRCGSSRTGAGRISEGDGG